MAVFRGIFVPMITPFNDKDNVDPGLIKTFVDFLVENGVHGLIPTASNG